MTSEPAIRLTGIVKSFGPVVANRGATLEIARGEIHALVGENGAGKSTLMRVLSGMYTPERGTMEVNGRDVTGWTTAQAIAAGVGMVPQHPQARRGNADLRSHHGDAAGRDGRADEHGRHDAGGYRADDGRARRRARRVGGGSRTG